MYWERGKVECEVCVYMCVEGVGYVVCTHYTSMATPITLVGAYPPH